MNLQAKIEREMRIVEDFPSTGISFKDFSGLFRNPKLSKDVIKALAEDLHGKVDVVCGIESRGFILGFPLALELNVPFVLVRKKGKLPPPVVSANYDLEYGSATLEMVENHIEPGNRVLIHDDVLATGGTAAACAKLVEKMGGEVVEFNFLIELAFLNGRKQLNTPVKSLISYAK
ncbi:MAG: adenine phosphoribosyltransferase [Weeksellaceae bacterium]|nr:adenine phosphoribosyltransferase [Weeksellaceae bacterium]